VKVGIEAPRHQGTEGKECRHPVVAYLGWQDDGEGGGLELYNCVLCKTTISRQNKQKKGKMTDGQRTDG